MNSPIPAPPKASTNPLKAIIKFLVKIFLFVLKPLGRVFWFIFEWPIKLAPILIIGGYSAALWEVDNAFLASAKKTRLSQTYAKTYDYFSSHVLVMDQKYNAITEQEAVARATMDRAQLVKEQFRFTVSALGNEIELIVFDALAVFAGSGRPIEPWESTATCCTMGDAGCSA